jgi:hypothetical protein
MAQSRRLAPALAQLRRSPRAIVLAAAALAGYATTGCLSNEYRIPKDELNRLVSLPPASRGDRVRVVQELGERRSDPVPPSAHPHWVEGAPPVETVVVEQQTQVGAQVYVDADFAVPTSYGSGGGGGGHWRSPSAGGGAARTGTGQWASRGSRSSGGGIVKSSGGGGGSGDDLAVVAIVIAAVAAFAVVGLAMSEGARFDGYTQIRPEQPVYLKNAAGESLVVPLAALAPEQVALATEATVKDDEGWGLRLLDHRPLDRVGATFKMTVGSLLEPPPAAAPQLDWQSGLASTIQFGGFMTPSLGLLASISLGGGSDSFGRTFQHHALGAEVQALPLRLGPLAVGGFGNAGLHIAGTGDDLHQGMGLGGGMLIEVALTTRLALSFRGGWTGTRMDNRDDWTGSGTITGGLAIY